MKRRKYLRSKTLAVVTAGMAGVLAVVGGVIADIIMRGKLYDLGHMEYGVFSGDVSDLENHFRTTITLGLFSLAVGLISTFICRDRVRHAKAIPYVASVRKQLANLPAEGILLRGSEQPVAATHELLRAAHEGEKMRPVDLLRAEQE